MHFSPSAVILGLLSLAGVSSATPITNTTTPALYEVINVTDTVLTNDTHLFVNETQHITNDTQLTSWMIAPRLKRRSLRKRGLPPRDRKLADHMENYGGGLPECYKKCMRAEDGKSSIHMGQDTLGQICGVKWPLFMWWTEHHLVFCVNGDNGCKGDKPHQDAYNWLRSTCGDKPN